MSFGRLLDPLGLGFLTVVVLATACAGSSSGPNDFSATAMRLWDARKEAIVARDQTMLERIERGHALASDALYWIEYAPTVGAVGDPAPDGTPRVIAAAEDGTSFVAQVDDRWGFEFEERSTRTLMHAQLVDDEWVIAFALDMPRSSDVPEPSEPRARPVRSKDLEVVADLARLRHDLLERGSSSELERFEAGPFTTGYIEAVASFAEAPEGVEDTARFSLDEGASRAAGFLIETDEGPLVCGVWREEYRTRRTDGAPMRPEKVLADEAPLIADGLYSEFTTRWAVEACVVEPSQGLFRVVGVNADRVEVTGVPIDPDE